MGQFICGCILLPHVLVDLVMYLILFTLIFLVSKTFFSFFLSNGIHFLCFFFSNNSVLIFYSFIYYFFENFVCFGHIHPSPIFLRSTLTSTHPSPYPTVCPFFYPINTNLCCPNILGLFFLLGKTVFLSYSITIAQNGRIID